MAATMTTSKACLAPAAGMGLRRQPTALRTASGLASRSVKPCVRRSERMSVQAAGFVEVAQLAGEQAEIFGPAAVVFACTLVGLAAGFVLLRVESLVEEGKIEL